MTEFKKKTQNIYDSTQEKMNSTFERNQMIHLMFENDT